MASCSVCFGTNKIRVGNDLYWCNKCTPRDHAGLLTDEAEELVQKKFAPASFNMKFYKPPSDIVMQHTSEGGIQPGFINTITSFTVSLEEEPQEDPQPPEQLGVCESCGDSTSTILVKTIESWEVYSWTPELIDGDWVLWADFQNAESGDTINDMKFECTNCGHMSSIPESFALEYR